MGVNVREKLPGSGVWWLFITRNGQRKSKKIGTDRKLAEQVPEKVKAKLVLGDLKVEKINTKTMAFKNSQNNGWPCLLTGNSPLANATATI